MDLNRFSSHNALPCDVATFYASRQLEALSEKFQGRDTASEDVRWLNTLTKFLEMEQKCGDTNKRLRQRDQFTDDLIAEMQLDIYRALPPVNEQMLKRVYGCARPGPGSTVGRTGQQNALAVKLSHFGTTYVRALQHVPGFLQENPAMAFMFQRSSEGVPALRPCSYDQLFMVDKKPDIGRMCGKSTDFCSWLQLGIGQVLSGVLRRHFSVDCHDQSLGWERAKRGSVSGDYSTLDLSSASDTVSLELVRRLLPPDWFELLMSVRAPLYKWDEVGPIAGGLRSYEKFSSMGNGYTFPLESLIFAAIVRAVCRRASVPFDYAVYGDDIVCPSSVAPAVVVALEALGFVPNKTKSFIDGPFRETCGKDFYRGYDVRPWFIRAEPRTEVDIYILHNVIATHPYGVWFEATLDYLRTLVKRPMFQPFYYGAGENWWDWEAWLVKECAFGFMVEKPDNFSPVKHELWQTTVYVLNGWAYKPFHYVGKCTASSMLALSLYSGSHRAEAWRAGRWVIRQKTISAWA
jgi:hypothetical protein